MKKYAYHAGWAGADAQEYNVQNALLGISGFSFETYKEDPSQFDGLFLHGLTTPEDPVYREWLNAGRGKDIALFTMECPGIQPTEFSDEVQNSIGKFLIWDLDRADGKKNFHVYQYYIAMNPGDGLDFHERLPVVFMNANKYFPDPHELYTARKALARSFYHTLDVYGDGWNADEWRNYYGRAVGHEIQRYRFRLVTETCRYSHKIDSDKLIGTLSAGVVPVYLGCPNIADYVDPAAFINVEEHASIVDVVLGMPESQWREIRDAGQRYLASTQYKRWFSVEAYQKSVKDALIADTT